MEELFRISEDGGSAFLHLLIEIQSQQTTAMLLMAETLSKVSDEDRQSIMERYEEVFLAQKQKCRSDIQLYFGDIDLNDILGGE